FQSSGGSPTTPAPTRAPGRRFSRPIKHGGRTTMWIYENTLKVEHQATTLSLYSGRLDKNQQITEVKNARRLETHFRSPQLDLWRLSDTEWLLALRRPAPIARKKLSKVVVLAEQLVLLEFGETG